VADPDRLDPEEVSSAVAVRALARYNRWQNQSLYAAGAELSAAERECDRGAFFGSIQRTFSHLMWGDTNWMSRFTPLEPPPCNMAQSPGWYTDLELTRRDRELLDEQIIAFAEGVTDAWLMADLSWIRRADGQSFTVPAWIAVTHFFNHQTHHRGQLHAMLTAARPTLRSTLDDTDFIAMRL
jgi:uncharacterized damage-inducible protein DinB